MRNNILFELLRLVDEELDLDGVYNCLVELDISNDTNFIRITIKRGPECKFILINRDMINEVEENTIKEWVLDRTDFIAKELKGALENGRD